MSPRNQRIAVLPREVATEVLTGALVRSGWAVGGFILLTHVPLVIDTLSRGAGIQYSGLPLACLVGMLLLLAYAGWRPSRVARILLLVVGGVLAFTFEVSLLLVDPALNGAATYLLNRPATVLVFVIPGFVRPGPALRWSVLGFAVAMTVLVCANLVTGTPISTGTGPVIGLLVMVSALFAVTIVRWYSRRQPVDLDRLQAETTRLALENQYEQRAAAAIHDTVLSDLTAVMNANGPIDSRMRERFLADVAALADGSWLRESRGLVTTDVTDEQLRNGMVALVSEMQWRGLSVDVTGNPEEEVVHLGAEQIAALHAAVRACLENVLQHAETESAELVLGAAQGEATIMVIDQGRGFEPAAVPDDRLGIRSSIIGRVEDLGGTVRVWSRPGHGTSVMLSMPARVTSGGSDVPNS